MVVEVEEIKKILAIAKEKELENKERPMAEVSIEARAIIMVCDELLSKQRREKETLIVI